MGEKQRERDACRIQVPAGLLVDRAASVATRPGTPGRWLERWRARGDNGRTSSSTCELLSKADAVGLQEARGVEADMGTLQESQEY